ncbi:MAG: hypothetical protein ABR563_07615 [Pyrinomonadaceae bacterium]
MTWIAAETDTHQDSVVAHVVGATALGYFAREEALHLLLDIGFYWVIYPDAQMTLLHENLVLAGLGDGERERLRADADYLRAQGDAAALSIMRAAPADCRIEGVEIYEDGARRRLFVRGGGASLEVETSTETCEFAVSEL